MKEIKITSEHALKVMQGETVELLPVPPKGFEYLIVEYDFARVVYFLMCKN